MFPSPLCFHTQINFSKVCNSLFNDETLIRCCLTPEAPATLAVEHFSLLDLAFGTVLAGIGLTGVVPTLTNPAAKETVPVALLKVEHPVVDIQHADAAHQT